MYMFFNHDYSFSLDITCALEMNVGFQSSRVSRTCLCNAYKVDAHGFLDYGMTLPCIARFSLNRNMTQNYSSNYVELLAMISAHTQF